MSDTRLSISPAALDSFSDAVIVTDAADRIVLWNAGAEELFGWTADEMLAQTPDRLFAPGEANTWAAVKEEARSAPDHRLDRSAVACGGELLWLTLTILPLTAHDPQPPGLLIVARDAAELPERDVELFATVSHELRTPLAAIKGYVTTLLDNFRRWDPATVEEFLETVNSSTDQLSGLVENLLDMSRLEGGLLRLQWRMLNLPELLAVAVESLEMQAQRHQFNIQFAQDFPSIPADRLRILQVVRNLLQNAVKYSPAGGVITISGEVVENYACVRVRDEGIGIPVEERERIFERFYQADNAQTVQSSGAGLGLYICRRIVEAHGGRIWVERLEAERGTVFVFRLPLQVPPAETASRPSADDRPVEAAAALGVRRPGHVRVLVVEDDKRLVRFVKANLEASGYMVLTASDGEAAIGAVERELPDLVLLDLMLPGLDGYAVCRRLREFSQVPIIMLTARADEADVVRGLDLGADDYLPKPFGTRELLARVRAVLRRSRFPEEIQTQPAFERDGLTIDFARRMVALDGEAVSLTPTEYKLLYHLAVNAGQVLTHRQLLNRVWGPAYEGESAYLWVYISRLRKKIEPDPEKPRYIISETGVGYRFSG